MNAPLIALAKYRAKCTARDRLASRDLGDIGASTIRHRRPIRGPNAGRRYFSAVAIQRVWRRRSAKLYGKALTYAMKRLGLPDYAALVYATTIANSALLPNTPVYSTPQDALDALYLPGDLFRYDPVMDARWFATVTSPF